MISLFYIILAVLGLSFLIFIHELGHYFMARRVGMRVETFAIGFGKPLYSWEKNGTKWQIGWLLFGGYVKIAGSELDGDKDPYSIPDGFFGKTPWDRIKVAFMGPLVNLVFAFIVFAALWAIGGRFENFSDYTSKIGWVDPASELYANGIRPGDEITGYNDTPFQSSMDHIYGPMGSSSEIVVHGNRVNYDTAQKTPFSLTVKVYHSPSIYDKKLLTAGILQSGSYIIYDRLPQGGDNPLIEGSPLQNSGLEYGDRLAWAGGEFLFSQKQLNLVLNDGKALLTIKRGQETVLRRVPRVTVNELRPDPTHYEELVDWQHEANLKGKTQDLYTIPYNLNNDGVVEEQLKFLDKDKESEAFPKTLYSIIDEPLHVGDTIIAINGVSIKQSHELLAHLQTNQINLIIERDPSIKEKTTYSKADNEFDQEMDYQDLQKIVKSIGTPNQINHAGKYILLDPITPTVRSAFVLSPENQAYYAAEQLEQKKVIDSIEDPEKQALAKRLLAEQDKKLLLGLPNIQDRIVIYNPDPMTLFSNVFNEIRRTLTALFTGALSPKFIAGPIGIVQVVHSTSMGSIREALYWMGAISLNLGMLNLLPIPVLDGGTIMLSLYEMISKKRIHPKTLEKLTIPFAVMLICAFLWFTYNDISRIFGGFF